MDYFYIINLLINRAWKMKRKDFIRNMLMGFAATLLPKTLLPSDGGLSDMEKAQLKLQNALNKTAPPGKYLDGSMYQVTYDTGYGAYSYWASGKMLNAMEAEHIRMFKYYAKK